MNLCWSLVPGGQLWGYPICEITHQLLITVYGGSLEWTCFILLNFPQGQGGIC